MPAHEQSFSDPLPELLYLDTDILISFLVGSEVHHDRTRRLLRQISDGGRTSLLISSLTWMEFTNVVLKAGFRTRLSPSLYRRFRLAQWQQAHVRRAYLESQLSALQSTLNQFVWAEASFTPAIRVEALRLISEYSLRPYDAVHLASALAAGCTHLASFDEGFRRVDAIALWNDLIHADRPIRP